MKRGIILFCTTVLIVLVVSSVTFAHHASIGSGIGQAGPVTTVSASTLKKGSFSFEALAEYQRFDTFSDGKLLGLAGRGEEDIHNVEYLLSPSVGLSYGVDDNLTVHLMVPYVSRNNISDAHLHEDEGPEIDRLGDAKGMGDITVFGHYRFLNQPELQSSLLAGLKMPTGKKSDKTGSGELFEAEFQPGSGSWDPIAGIALSKPMGAYSVDSNILYTFVTEGVQDTDLGDVFNYNISIARNVVMQKIKLDLILEANGIWRGKQKIDGEKDKNSGGNTILISPGARVGMNSRMTIYFSVGFPVIQDLDGEQNKMDYRTILGISMLL